MPKRADGKKGRRNVKPKSIKAKITSGLGSKRRLAKFGKEQKKGLKGYAANYITRSQALKKLQITLRDFRRLCILKGIYPRDPKKKSKGKDKTYYYYKDIMFLAYEPLLEEFRQFKAFMKKIKRAIGRKDYDDARRREESKPVYTLDHIVKERYPQFTDALGDLDDALCMIHLFALLPAVKLIKPERTMNCLKLAREFQNYVCMTKCLKKAFVSIKGIYYQCEIMGQKITWLVPHQFMYTMAKQVDLRVMLTFLEFYEVLLKFVNFKLYSDIGICYPPKIDLQLDEAGAQLAAIQSEPLANAASNEDCVNETTTTDKEEDLEEDVEIMKNQSVLEQQKLSKQRIATLGETLKNIQENSDSENEEEEAPSMIEPLEKAFASNKEATELHSVSVSEHNGAHLFSGFRFFLSREVPHACLELIIRSHGGEVGWSGNGSPYSESSDFITHHVMDRPHQGHRYFSREYIQPQWIFDSINNSILLPIEKYLPGLPLPPHLSPFVDDVKEGYTPDYRKELNKLQSSALGTEYVDESDKEMEEENEEENEEEAFEKGMQEERNATDKKATTSNSDSEGEDLSEEETVEETNREEIQKKTKRQREEEELKELAHSVMPKKVKRLYDRMQFGLQKKAQKIKNLEEKRRNLVKNKKL